MSVNGTAVVGRPESIDRARGAVAAVNLYGPRGGYVGATTITRSNALEVISRLQSLVADADIANKRRPK